MGFGSQARLNVHLHYHEKQGKKPAAHLVNIDKDDDVELIILDAVKADDIDLVSDFIADVPRFSRKFFEEALVSSSYEMLDVLLKACNSELNYDNFNESHLLNYAVDADNLEATRMLLNRGASLKYRGGEVGTFPGIAKAMSNLSPKMIKVLLSDRHIQEMIAKNEWRKPSLGWIFFRNLERSKEARLIQCLSLLPDWTQKRKEFESCFVDNTERFCSIAIAEFLLRNGVNINSHPNGGNTALFHAAKRKDQRAAEMMKFLLESGADPLAPALSRSQPIADRPGPRNISKWLGVSWEQLVEESRKKHAASLEMGPQ